MSYIKFLGTAGARVVVAKQLRASGGIWLSLDQTNIFLDPGPGALVKCVTSRPRLEPSNLNAIILSHRHLDHSADVNAMIEAMTEGGFKKRGILFAPRDALTDDPVVLKYVREYLKEVRILKENGQYQLNNVEFFTPVRHVHGTVETYGINFNWDNLSLSYIVDTRLFPELTDYYKGKVLIINMVRHTPADYDIDHLCLEDVKHIISKIKPQVCILTHFGMTVLRAKPWELATQLEKQTKVKVIAATDGMTFQLV